MSVSATAIGPAVTAARARPPSGAGGPWGWARANLFNSWASSIATVILAYLILRFIWVMIDWGVIHAIWTVPQTAAGQPDPSSCRAAKGIGACWAVVHEKYRFILFGFYPYAEQWRPAICLVLFIGLYVASAWRKLWRRELIFIWIATLVVVSVLMWGGIFGLTYVAQDQWGGLPITLMLATFGLLFAFPLAILVALGRRSTRLPAVKLLCVVYVELVRGVPLISLLFMASVMFPLFLPPGINIDKLLRAQIAIILFAAAYLSEVVRSGLQSLPKGQYEAGDALGLSYWKLTGLIVLPQALRIVIPPLVNTFIGFFKDTSLVLIIGIFDLMTTGLDSILEPTWQGFGNEIYILLASVYFVFCFAMSKYSRSLERDFSRAKRR
jgi:general L-amino acid transport system permease protein